MQRLPGFTAGSSREMLALSSGTTELLAGGLDEYPRTRKSIAGCAANMRQTRSCAMPNQDHSVSTLDQASPHPKSA